MPLHSEDRWERNCRYGADCTAPVHSALASRPTPPHSCWKRCAKERMQLVRGCAWHRTVVVVAAAAAAWALNCD